MCAGRSVRKLPQAAPLSVKAVLSWTGTVPAGKRRKKSKDGCSVQDGAGEERHEEYNLGV